MVWCEDGDERHPEHAEPDKGCLQEERSRKGKQRGGGCVSTMRRGGCQLCMAVARAFTRGGGGCIHDVLYNRSVRIQQQRSNVVTLSSLQRAPFGYFRQYEQCLRGILVCVNLSGAAVGRLPPPATPHVI
jgi:hypothetical protein